MSNDATAIKPNLDAGDAACIEILVCPIADEARRFGGLADNWQQGKHKQAQRTADCFLVCMFHKVIANRLTTQLRHSRPRTSDMPTEAFNGCCLERLVSQLWFHISSAYGQPS